MPRGMPKREFVKVIQQYVAIASVGVSAVRGQAPGTRWAAVAYLAQIDLGRLPRHARGRYAQWLDARTGDLRDRLPGRNKPWGVARKAMNLFMRGCLYNHYLRKEYGLAKVEPWLEIPLDSVTAKALKKHAGRGALPRWPGLKRLTPRVNRAFQDYASTRAEELGLPARRRVWSLPSS